MPNSLHVGHSKEHFTIFNRMETANKQRSGCANYTSEKVYYFFFFPWHLESHLRPWNIQKEALEDLPLKEKMPLSTIVFQTIFIVIYFLARKKETIHIQENSTAKWLCLTLLQSETLGNIHLSTLYKYLSWKGGPGRGHL